jgi:Ran GTPase-activating protein (RanGAP) involved in mRNA processing and transport
MKFCNIEEDAGVAIGDVLANARSALEVLDLGGNRLRGAGLQSLCRGLRVNRVLKTLSLADNGIDQDPPDLEGLGALRDCLLEPTLELTSVDLLYNRIGEAGALVLAPALTPENKKIGEFLVDLTLPMPIFEQIFRRGGGKKKGKKGKKK